MQQFAARGRDTARVSSASGSGEPPKEDTPRVTTEGAAPPAWLAEDKVTQLREWASDTAHAVRVPVGGDLVIGVHESADLTLVDTSGKMSRRHARLTRDMRGDLHMVDLRSRNGIYVDGTRVRRTP